MLRWIDVEPDDIGCFLLKVRIVGSHVALDPVGLQSGAFPNPGDHHVSGSQMSGQLAATPMRGSIRRRLACPCQYSSLHLRRSFFHCSARMSRVQTRQTVFEKPVLPSRDVAAVRAQRFTDHRERLAVGKHQYQTSSSHIIGPQRSGAHSSLQFPFHFRRHSYSCSGHARTLTRHSDISGPTFNVTGH